MSSRHITVATICLVFAVVFGFVLNCLALFLKQWLIAGGKWHGLYSMLDRDGTPQSRHPLHYIGLIPIYTSGLPAYFTACSLMMVISFALYVMLVGFFIFGLVSFMLKKTKLARIGYRLVAIISLTTAVLQITSFIVTLACQQMYDNRYAFDNPSVGACVYLALTSGILGFCSLGLSWFLQRGLGGIDSQ